MELDGSITRFRRSSVRIMTEPRLILRGAGDAYRTLRVPDKFLQARIKSTKTVIQSPSARCLGVNSARRPDADRRRVHLRKLAKSSRYPVFAGR